MKWLSRLLHYISWPARFIFLGGSKRVRVMIMHGDRVLLVKGRISKGDWVLPGGGVGKDETPQQAAQREVKEELGLDFSLNDLHELFESTMIREGIRTHFTGFLVHVQNEEITPNKLEIARAEWFALDALPEHLSPVVRQALKAVEK